MTYRSRAVITTRILLADDYPLLRQGIRELLEREKDFEVVAEAEDGEQAVKLANDLSPDVVLIDVSMPKLSGLEATRKIKAEHPSVRVLVLTVHDEEEYILGLLEAGATGYLLKSAYGEELVQAIRSVRTGEYVFHPIVAQRLLKCALGHQQARVARTENIDQLTVREIEVLKLACTGMSYRDIARELGIEVRTVKGHLVNIFSKMQVSSRTEAVLRAMKHNLVTVEDII